MKTTNESSNKMACGHFGKSADSFQFCDECEKLREWVVEFMHYSGTRRKMLSNAKWTNAYLLADGFGAGISKEFASAQIEWDWSHVRDSSINGFKAMAEYIEVALPKAQRWNETDEQFAARTKK